jgi:hypothetical protein
VVGPVGLAPDVELQIAGVPAAAIGELLKRVGAVVLLRRNDIDMGDGDNGVLAGLGRRDRQTIVLAASPAVCVSNAFWSAQAPSMTNWFGRSMRWNTSRLVASLRAAPR